MSKTAVKKTKTKVKRAYTDRTLKILWGRAAGRCALPDCRIDVLVDATEHDPIVVVGEIAHIEGAASGAARHNPKQSPTERDDYDNLILLCSVCHKKLDGQKHTNTVAKIKSLRAQHEAWVRENLPERGRSRVGWKVLVLQGAHPIELPATLTALAPDYEEGKPRIIAVDRANDWSKARTELEKAAKKAMANGNDPFTSRLAVFPLAPVSACVALGYLLTNRPTIRAFQFHRDQRSWAWARPESDAVMPRLTQWPENASADAIDVAICFDLSARVPDTSLSGAGRDFAAVLRVGVAAPSTSWLQTEEQLTRLGAIARETFERVATEFPKAKKWHIFYAGPAPGAVIVGQQLNPTMTPPVQLYEFQLGASPEHSPSLVLEAGRLPAASVNQ